MILYNWLFINGRVYGNCLAHPVVEDGLYVHSGKLVGNPTELTAGARVSDGMYQYDLGAPVGTIPIGGAACA